MKIILVVATSLDGKITMGDNPSVHAWTSEEDTTHFRSMLEKASLVVMGRATYDTMKATMKHKSGRLRVIFTHNPEKYKSEEIPGQLEFTNESPTQLIKRLRQSHKELLLVSGAGITTLFFKEDLVDEVHLTLEPWIFGSGKPVVLQEDLNMRLQLLSSEKLNKRGTLLLHYKAKK